MTTPTPIERSFKVSYGYTLYHTTRVFDLQNDLFKSLLNTYRPNSPIKLLVVLDSGVQTHHPELVDQITRYCNTHSNQVNLTEIISVQGGETCKTDPRYLQTVLAAINNNRICRHSFVVAIGGGAILDMAGYAAATAHRGVQLIRIPTTVLSQNDSAVGVKNGINAFGKKNFLGTFAPPYAVINDSSFLPTLEKRDRIAGIAEAIKVGLVKDRAFFDYIEENTAALASMNMDHMRQLILQCAHIHMDHIALGGDPFESGSSRPLDFGHWAAHKLEQMSNYDIRHGEAVAKGIAIDVCYSFLTGLLGKAEMERILNVLKGIGFDLNIPVKNDDDISILLLGIEEFREHLGGKLTITLLNAIGSGHDVHHIDMEIMRKAILMVDS